MKPRFAVPGPLRSAVKPVRDTLDMGPAADTFPKLLARNASRHPNDIALREKEFGIWRSYSWTEYAQRVQRRALGLAAIGVKPGEVIGLIGDNRPDWVFSEIAAHALRAMSLGIYRDALDEEVAYLINFADVPHDVRGHLPV